MLSSMGSSTSKAASTAGSTVRKYPSRVPPQSSTSPRTKAPPIVHQQAQPSGSRDDEITRDASDLDLAFSARLAQIGPVQPSPTLFNSSTVNTSIRASQLTSQSKQHVKSPSAGPSMDSFQPSASTPFQTIFPSLASNPAVSILMARSKIAKEAEDEFESLGRRGSPGRSFLDVVTIRQVLMMRDEQKKDAAEIERTLGLKRGLVEKLGVRGVYSGAGA